MRRLFIGGGLILLLVLVFFGSRYFLSNRASSDQFSVTDDADFYVVYTDSINSYQLDGGSISEMSSSQLPVAEFVNTWFSKGEFAGRYLVFSEDELKGESHKPAIVSIDFEKGSVKKTPTSYFAYTGAGTSDQYFYTFQATTEDGGLHAFDQQGKHVDSYVFDESTTPASQFAGRDGRLYLSATQETSDGMHYEHKLFTFEEKAGQLTQVDELLLDDDSEWLYGFTSNELIDQKLFLPVTARRNRATYESIPDNRVLVLDLISKEKNFIELPESYPNLIFKSKNLEHLMVVHESSMLGKVGLSVVNTTSQESYFLDIGQALHVNELDTIDIVSVNTTKDNKLLVLAGDTLLAYDLDSGQLLSTLEVGSNDESSGIYIWAN